jgi:hypothetical protein
VKLQKIFFANVLHFLTLTLSSFIIIAAFVLLIGEKNYFHYLTIGIYISLGIGGIISLPLLFLNFPLIIDLTVGDTVRINNALVYKISPLKWTLYFSNSMGKKYFFDYFIKNHTHILTVNLFLNGKYEKCRYFIKDKDLRKSNFFDIYYYVDNKFYDAVLKIDDKVRIIADVEYYRFSKIVKNINFIPKIEKKLL